MLVFDLVNNMFYLYDFFNVKFNNKFFLLKFEFIRILIELVIMVIGK